VFVLLEMQEGGWWFWRDETKCGGLLMFMVFLISYGSMVILEWSDLLR
jgi:hypothetical protein